MAIARSGSAGTSGRARDALALTAPVDVIAGPVAIVFTDVTFVDLVPGVEVQFRRGNGDYLIVARGGKVVVRA